MLSNVTDVICRAREFIQKDDFDQAERELLLALEKKMVTSEVYFLLGDIYLRKNLLKEAKAAFDKVISLDGSDYLAYLNLGNIYLTNGDLNQAEKYLSLVLEKGGEYRNYVLTLLGDVYWKKERFPESFYCFKAALKIHPEDEELLDKAARCQAKMDSKEKISFTTEFIRNYKLIIQYYLGTSLVEGTKYQDTFNENYAKNITLLKKKYPNLFKKLKDSSENLNVQIIPIGEYFDLLISRNGNNTWMYGFSHPLDLMRRITTSYKKHTSVCLVGMAGGYELQSIFKLSANPFPPLWIKIPIYIIEPSVEIFKANLMMHDLSDILSSDRVFFFLGERCLDDLYLHLIKDQIMLPQMVILLDRNISNMRKACIKRIKDINKRQKNELKSLIDQINTYYKQITEKDWKEIYSPNRRRPLRVLGITSRFTTFLQYCMRDVMDAFSQLGCETAVLKEDDDVKRLTPLIYAKTLNSFKPDLIFTIDHNSSEFPYIPKCIPFVNWVQDELPNILNASAAKEMGKRDLILANETELERQLVELGYPKKKIMVQPVVSNPKVYKPVTLQKYDLEKYSCDVSFVHHGGKSPEQELDELLANTSDLKVRKFIKTMYEILHQRFLKGYYCYWNEYDDLFKKTEEMAKYKISSRELSDFILYHFKYVIGNRFIRQIPLEKIAALGIDLKLYGRDWENHPRLFKYACGIAKNGEELNKIYNASKIILHLQPASTTNPRVFDAMASRGFLLVQYLNYDLESIENYFEENKEFVFFKDNSDLKKKVSFFLNHPEERERIAQGAYRKIIERYNYKFSMKRVMEIIARDPNNISINGET